MCGQTRLCTNFKDGKLGLGQWYSISILFLIANSWETHKRLSFIKEEDPSSPGEGGGGGRRGELPRGLY